MRMVASVGVRLMAAAFTPYPNELFLLGLGAGVTSFVILTLWLLLG